MRRSYRTVIPVAAGSLVLAAAMGAAAQSPAAPCRPSLTPATVSLQLQWAPQAQFAGYFAAAAKGFYAEQGLDRQPAAGRPDRRQPDRRLRPQRPRVHRRWVPKVLVLRDQGQSDLVDIAQVFQRSGTREVSWAPGKGPIAGGRPGHHLARGLQGQEGRRLGLRQRLRGHRGAPARSAWRPAPTTSGSSSRSTCRCCCNRQIDAAEAMIYNEYAQVLEATNPDTGKLYQPERPQRHRLSTRSARPCSRTPSGHARRGWRSPGNEDIATRFLPASFKGWQYCRDNADDCVQIVLDAGSTLGARASGLAAERDQLARLAVRRWHRRDAGRHLGPDGPDRHGRQASSRPIRRHRRIGPTWPTRPGRSWAVTPRAAATSRAP